MSVMVPASMALVKPLLASKLIQQRYIGKRDIEEPKE